MKYSTKKIDKEGFCQKLVNFLDKAEGIGRETKFVQRKSRISGLVFLKTMIFGFMEDPQASLTDLARQSYTLGVVVNPQAIHERINRYAVEFMKCMFLHAFEQFKNKLSLPFSILQQFNGICIVDSTHKTLPASMAEEYPGSGGQNSAAGLKVQLVFEFIKGNMVQLEIGSSLQPDQKYVKYLEIAQKGSLFITDLGYYCFSFLQNMKEKGAYFLTRYRFKTALYLPCGKSVNLIQLLEAQGEEMLDIAVEVGESKKDRVPVRLIANKVPPEVVEERRRKAKRKNQKNNGIVPRNTWIF